MLPLLSKDDADFFKHLEIFMRNEEGVSLVGRDHVSFRSYFLPVKVRGWLGAESGVSAARCFSRPPPCAKRPPPAFPPSHPSAQDVIDGDLCEVFASLPLSRQRALAEDLDRTPHEVMKKLEDARQKML